MILFNKHPHKDKTTSTLTHSHKDTCSYTQTGHFPGAFFFFLNSDTHQRKDGAGNYRDRDALLTHSGPKSLFRWRKQLDTRKRSARKPATGGRTMC